MVITKTSLRMVFLGGETVMESFCASRKHGGQCFPRPSPVSDAGGTFLCGNWGNVIKGSDCW